jgi:hypothetical protein
LRPHNDTSKHTRTTLPVQVQIFDQISELRKQLGQAPDFFTAERLIVAIDIFDIHAREYLKLVSDMEAQNAFEVILDECVNTAWKNYCGYPADAILPDVTSVAYLELRDRKSHWLAEGFRKLARKSAETAETQTVTQLVVKQSRRQFIEPLLSKKGLSPSKWASRAGVDPSVVYDYLNDTSDPRPDSRKALAGVLGLEPSELPE